MTGDFSDPSSGHQNVVLIDAATLRKAEEMIASCEQCNPEATMPFDWILHLITDFGPRITLSTLLEEDLLRPEPETDYILQESAKCPHCKREVSEKTVIEAVWFRDLLKQADQGESEAQVNLAELYATRQVVPEDQEEAVKWYRKAADQGYSDGQVSLGLWLTIGKSNSQDNAEAIELFRKAADQLNVHAMSILAHFYLQGRGVAQDYVQAHMWYNLAASVPSSLFDMDKRKFAEARDELAAKMTPQQVAESERLAREWKPKNPNDSGL